ncbi:Arc family DNA-binding protein [uncultured Paraglaciecola sp.]|uniref:Arc family DNA-binding protein n=1 Tax=uncultured Paraglaciecola sp. TaxID=1765024 RepID=UPI0026185B94|nr:Arc family DNA-binding protein [uncultured Paraglaciecola sp.]
MSKKAFPLRINADVLAAMQRWADDDLRSVNAQIEYVLRDALVKQGRVKLVQKTTTEVVDVKAAKTK